MYFIAENKPFLSYLILSYRNGCHRSFCLCYLSNDIPLQTSTTASNIERYFHLWILCTDTLIYKNQD